MLSCIVSEALYNRGLNDNEGVLSKKRDLIISRENLNNIAKEMLDKKLLKHNAIKISKNMYGNYLEAIIGALYLDQGIEKTKTFIEKKILAKPKINKASKKDFKSKLMLWSVHHKKNINFIVLDSVGPDHKKKHNIGLMLEGRVIKTHWAYSVKEGEQNVSKQLYEQINGRDTFFRAGR